MKPRLDQSHALALAAVMGPTVALYAALGMAPLFVVTTVGALAATWRHRPWSAIRRPDLWVFAAILGWATIGLAWTLDRPQALHTLAALGALSGGGLLLVAMVRSLSDAGRRRVRLALAAGLTLALCLAVLENFNLGPGTLRHPQLHPLDLPYHLRISRGLTVVALLLGPATAAAWHEGHRRWAVAMAALAVLAIVSGHALSAKIAILLIPLVFAIALVRPRLAANGLAAGALAAALAFPLLAMAPAPQETMDRYAFLPNSAHHRLTIWTFTAGKILERPALGWGLDASRAIPGAEDINPIVRHFRLPPNAPRDGIRLNEQNLPLHPHSGPGQIWLELGGIGIALLGALLIAVTRRIPAAPTRLDGAVAGVAIAAAVVVSSVSYGIWQSWWLSSLWLCAALYTAIVPAAPPKSMAIAGASG